MTDEQNTIPAPKKINVDYSATDPYIRVMKSLDLKQPPPFKSGHCVHEAHCAAVVY